MKLSLKFSAILIIGIVVLSAVDGFLRVRRQIALFENDMRRDHRSMGATLASAAADIWSAEGEQPAHEMINKFNRKKTDVEIRWLRLDGQGEGRPDAPAADGVRAAVTTGKPAETIEARESGDRHLCTYLPVTVDGRPVGALEISESFVHQQRYVRSTIVRAILTTLATVVILCSAVLLLGYWFVGRPINALVEKTRRVGAGDFTWRLRLGQRDELAALADEMNIMSGRLEEANRKVATETAARIAALEQLRHADRLTTVGQLASGIAHEVGTPLNVVSGRAKMIATGRAAGDEIAGNARIIMEQVDRIAGTIRQLLDFARRRESRRAVVDIRLIVRKTLELLEPVVVRAGVDMRLVDAAGPVLADVDDAQLQQALTNLVINGIQAMPGGGVLTVAVGTAAATPPPGHGGPEGEHARISVRDEGIGIPADNIPQLFDPFFTTKDVGEGTGLGLSVAYGIARENDGWIGVESEEGGGSTFTIYLPREAQT
ncbi:MAG: ATP-binding protein [Pseudomonadota bacterium]